MTVQRTHLLCGGGLWHMGFVDANHRCSGLPFRHTRPDNSAGPNPSAGIDVVASD
jgi:hypothetical protein